MNAENNAWTRKLALVLIICAVAGTEISYHFTLESRFESIEEKLAQQTSAIQAMQESLDTTESSKNETLSGLNKQLTSLQSSFEPLGKTTQAQADALSQVHEQLAALQQAQSDQQDAQKKLSAYLAQLEATVKKARADAAAMKSAPAPGPASLPAPAASAPSPQGPVTSAPVALPVTNAASDLMASPGAVSHPGDPAESMAADVLPVPTAPRAQAVMDLRPADAATYSGVAPRALPVGASLSSKR